ncbi:MAG: hypothetical protein VX613_04940 [Candidatus Thermoplasmatota archaeon]|nr:hypothetical protein [Candidatus Thermoplasmatota archaeon]|tara:strand:+ start:1578 stop:2012 length:435 start_codon:yes stop_codon:yes gene_type:complete
MRNNDLIKNDSGQMLLAAGLVLLMSLLSMSLYGVKVAGYDLPRTSDVTDVLDTTEEVEKIFLPSLENRTQIRVDAGMDLDDAVLDSLDSIEYDLKSHGILRGMQISLTDLEIEINENNVSVMTILNIVSDSTIELPLSIEFEIL